jgi:hypothetical protein
MRYFLFFCLVLCTSISEAEKKTEIKIKSKQIQALILFFGDYKALQEFNGPVQQNISGVFNETKDFVPNTDCNFNARFQDVLYKKSLHLKINFDVNCDKINIKLNPEYVRLKDLKVDSAGFYLSKKHKNVQFKIVELKYN